MAKSIAEMADEILNGALSNPAAAVNEIKASIPENERPLPDISDEARDSLLQASLLTEDYTANRSREITHGLAGEEEANRQGIEAKRKKAEWDKKNREKRTASRHAASVRGDRLSPGETNRQAAHTSGRGKKAGAAGHRDTRKSPAIGSPTASPSNSAHWRGEVEKTKTGTSTNLTNNPAGTKFAKGAHKSAINRSRTARGAKPIEGVQIMKTGKTMTLVDAKDKNWIQGAEKDIERRGTKGKCTPITKPGCTGKAKALAKTFKKMAKKRDAEVVSKDEKGENGNKFKGMKKEHLAILAQAKQIIDEMTAAGSIGVNMAGSSNKKYDTNGKPMGKDNVTVAPIGREMRSVVQSQGASGDKLKPIGKGKTAKKKSAKVKKESFETFLDSIVTEAQKCS